MILASLCRVTKRREGTKKSELMSRKGRNFVGQPAVFWGTRREDQCFGEEEELDDTRDGEFQIIVLMNFWAQLYTT